MGGDFKLMCVFKQRKTVMEPEENCQQWLRGHPLPGKRHCDELSFQSATECHDFLRLCCRLAAFLINARVTLLSPILYTMQLSDFNSNIICEAFCKGHLRFFLKLIFKAKIFKPSVHQLDDSGTKK